MFQLAAELLAYGGLHEQALCTVERATDGVLIDIQWMRRCPVLEPLRADPRFAKAQATVARRATEIWSR